MTTQKDFTPDILIYNNKYVRTTKINGEVFLVGGDVCKSLNVSTKWGAPRYRHLLDSSERMLVFKEELPTIIKWKDYETALTLISLSGFDKLKLTCKTVVNVTRYDDEQAHKPLKLNKDNSINTNEDLLLTIKDLIDKYAPNRLQIPSGYSTE
jgi:hypothetical protein